MILPLLILLIIYLLTQNNNHKKEKIIGKTWYQCPNSNSDTILKRILKRNNIQQVNSNWELYLPCSYDFSNKTLAKFNIKNSEKKIFQIHNNNLLGSKRNLWNVLLSKYGRNTASNIMPISYVLPHDKQLLVKNYNPNKIYFAKKEIQRQRGLHITRNLKEILDSPKEKYTIIQELETNPLLFSNHKVNIRIYLLITCQNGEINAYVYDDGMITYAKEKYKEGVVDFGRNVSSFATSKGLYDAGYPITIKQYLSVVEDDALRRSLVEGVDDILSKLMGALRLKICRVDNVKRAMSFQLFGVDIMIKDDKKRTPKLLEINVGPGMNSYQTRDRIMREKLQQDILEKVGVIPDSGLGGFRRIYSNF